MQNDKTNLEKEIDKITTNEWRDPIERDILINQAWMSPRKKIVAIGIYVLSGTTIVSCICVIFFMVYALFANGITSISHLLEDLLYIIPFIFIAFFLIIISLAVVNKANRNYKNYRALQNSSSKYLSEENFIQEPYPPDRLNPDQSKGD
jgi:hypothetical protein